MVRKRWKDKNTIYFEVDNNKKYKIKVVWNNAGYIKKLSKEKKYLKTSFGSIITLGAD